MPSTPEEKKKVLTRVRRIRGQIDALERALENGAECRAILQQIAAVRGASKEGANKQVISSQADSLIKISRIWADFFPANTSNQPI